MVENHSTIGTSQLLIVAGFVAIFIEASYQTGAGSDAVFYRGTCHVTLQHLAADKRYSLKLMGAILLMALGGVFLWLFIDLLFLGWWLDKYEKSGREGLSGINASAVENLSRRSRAMFYSGLGILPGRGDTGAGVMFVGAAGLALFVKGLSVWVT